MKHASGVFLREHKVRSLVLKPLDNWLFFFFSVSNRSRRIQRKNAVAGQIRCFWAASDIRCWWEDAVWRVGHHHEEVCATVLWKGTKGRVAATVISTIISICLHCRFYTSYRGGGGICFEKWSPSANTVCSVRFDPDILVGYEVQLHSWGYLLQRSSALGVDLCQQLSRVPGTARSHWKVVPAVVPSMAVQGTQK